jgi:hypothetical protein
MKFGPHVTLGLKLNGDSLITLTPEVSVSFLTGLGIGAIRKVLAYLFPKVKRYRAGHNFKGWHMTRFCWHILKRFLCFCCCSLKGIFTSDVPTKTNAQAN